MNIKSITLAAILASSASIAFAGNVFDLGDITLDGALFVSPTYAKGVSIADTWNFSLTGDNDVAALLSRNFSTAIGAISGFSATVSGGTLVGVTDLALASTSTSQNLTFGSTLGAGNYSVTVSGLTQRANTLYTFSVDVTPVPEPQTYAMLMAGLGVLGFVARRRKAV